MIEPICGQRTSSDRRPEIRHPWSSARFAHRVSLAKGIICIEEVAQIVDVFRVIVDLLVEFLADIADAGQPFIGEFFQRFEFRPVDKPFAWSRDF